MNQIALYATESTDVGMGSVVLLGVGIVFVVLICIILLCNIMSAIMVKTVHEVPKPVTAPAPIAPVATVSEDKNQIIAAIGVAVAETMGTDVSRIKIHSIKKI